MEQPIQAEPEFIEVLGQEYENGKISGGFVSVDDRRATYLKLQRSDGQETVLILRPDELLSLAWCASGVMWSLEMSRLALEPTDDEPRAE